MPYRKPCNLHVISMCNWTGKHPLHVQITDVDSTKLAVAVDRKSFLGVLRTSRYFRHHLSLVVKVQIVRWFHLDHPFRPLSSCEANLTDVGDNPNSKYINLYVTPLFMEHYGINGSPTDYYTMKYLRSPIVLDAVVLRAQTEEVLDWVIRPSWSTSLLLSVCEGEFLCRTGDVLLLPGEGDVNDFQRFGLVVLRCSPVMQGVLTATTAVKILPPEHRGFGSAIDLTPGTTNHEERHHRTHNTTFPNLISYAKLSGFVITLFRSRLDSTTSSPAMAFIVTFLNVVEKLLCHLTTAEMDIQILAKSPFRSRENGIASSIDEFSLVLVSSEFLNGHHLKSMDWVRVSLSSARIRPPRLVRVLSIDQYREEMDLSLFGQIGESVAYVTPLLWFNLNRHPSLLIQPDTKLCVEKFASLPRFPERSRVKYEPAFANEVHISMIRTPEHKVSVQCDVHLQKYFAIPRYLSEGDIMCIEVDSTIESFHFIDCRDAPKYAYFKVVKLVGSQPHPNCGYFASIQHSSLYQDSQTQMYVPHTAGIYLSSPLLHPLWDSPLPAGLSSYADQLASVLVSHQRLRVLSHEGLPTVCLSGQSTCGKIVTIRAVARLLNVHLHIVNCWDLKAESMGAMEAKIENVYQKASSFTPCLLVFKNLHAFCGDQQQEISSSRALFAFTKSLLQYVHGNDPYPLFVVGTTTDWKHLNSGLAANFLHHIHVDAPRLEERKAILSAILETYALSPEVSISHLADTTAGFVLGDFCTLVSQANLYAYRRILEFSHVESLQLSREDQEDICVAGPVLLPSDFDYVLQELQRDQAKSFGAPKACNVQWDDIGGLEDVKAHILDTVQLPLQHPELFISGLKRSGILLYGPPGTGKTLLAKAVATECALNFLSVKGPELINMYVGQSEENVREVFQRARSAAPCVIFFDELDSLAPNRGRSGDSTGVMDRVVSQMLAELDGIQKSVDVFVIGATNRPDLLDPALLRPGRFDKLLYVGIGSSPDARLKVLKAQTRKFNLEPGFKLEEFVHRCPPNLTGADVYALCADALLKAMARKIALMERGDVYEQELVILEEDFNLALDALVPSVSESDMKRYQSLQHKIMQ